MMTFFRISPYFSCFSTFPPVSRKLLFPPYFHKFPLCFKQFHLLFTYFTCISFPPYFDHDAFMHHPMHVLDAPARTVGQRTIGQADCSPRGLLIKSLFVKRTISQKSSVVQLMRLFKNNFFASRHI